MTKKEKQLENWAKLCGPAGLSILAICGPGSTGAKPKPPKRKRA